MNFSFNKENKATSLEEKKLDLDAGLLGKLFGNSSSAPTNIAGIVILLVVFISIFMTIKENSSNEIWKITTPIITLILGYLFGKNKSE